MSDTGISQTPQIEVHYHDEAGGWWGEVIRPRWHVSAVATTLHAVRKEMRELLPFAVDERLVARSLLFVHWHKTPFTTFSHDAAEAFVLVERP